MTEPNTVTAEQRVLEIVAGVLTVPAEALGADPALAAHGWTSMTAMETFVALEEEFHVTLDLSALARAHSVEVLVGLVVAAGA